MLTPDERRRRFAIRTLLGRDGEKTSVAVTKDGHTITERDSLAAAEDVVTVLNPPRIVGAGGIGAGKGS